MKARHTKKAFSDPQSLAAAPEAVAALITQLQKTPLQIDQRFNVLKSLFVDSYLFPNANASSPSADASNDMQAPQATVQVLDYTFGAGLDFLLTWKLWLQASQDKVKPTQLSYFAICEQPLYLEGLKQLHQNWPQLESLSLQLQEQYPDAIKGFHQLDFGGVKLTIIMAEAEHALVQIRGEFDVHLNGVERQLNMAYTPPWERPVKGVAHNNEANKKAIKVAIIGAGISGVATAYSLSKRGFDVTLIDQGSTLASGASGNRQAMLYAKLPDNATIAGQFHQQGLQHTMGLLKRSLSTEYWQPCGLLQLATSAKQVSQMQAVMNRQYPASWLQLLDQTAAEKLAKSHLSAGGLYFPHSGWVSSTDWCAALYTLSGAELWLNTKVESLQQSQNSSQTQNLIQGWQLQLTGDHTGLYTFDAVVVANANSAQDLLPSQSIPLKSIRGQVSYVETCMASVQSPALVLCSTGYVTPAKDGVLAVGASYNLHTADTQLSTQDHVDNLGRLSEVLPSNKGLGIGSITGGRVGFRAVTPDYLPLVGQLADEVKVLDRFAKLRQDANYKFADDMPYFTGLYINAGHGSKGLISAPLSAEMLACQMANQSLPVAQCVARSLDPNRFIIRDLIRRKR
ncbi:MAG: tRNA U-34 5-methylaminomethyl-2-thiouridine biosynthesis protein MnmC [Oceanospirillaceae bacterium]|jgi:tRNA U-34 5-methylaminomethyl-2-thiouridine biosynthesis protein MnmC